MYEVWQFTRALNNFPWEDFDGELDIVIHISSYGDHCLEKGNLPNAILSSHLGQYLYGRPSFKFSTLGLIFSLVALFKRVDWGRSYWDDIVLLESRRVRWVWELHLPSKSSPLGELRTSCVRSLERWQTFPFLGKLKMGWILG